MQEFTAGVHCRSSLQAFTAGVRGGGASARAVARPQEAIQPLQEAAHALASPSNAFARWIRTRPEDS